MNHPIIVKIINRLGDFKEKLKQLGSQLITLLSNKTKQVSILSKLNHHNKRIIFNLIILKLDNIFVVQLLMQLQLSKLSVFILELNHLYDKLLSGVLFLNLIYLIDTITMMFFNHSKVTKINRHYLKEIYFN
jgi:hypothetical protein